MPLRVRHTECFGFSFLPLSHSTELQSGNSSVTKCCPLLHSRYGWFSVPECGISILLIPPVSHQHRCSITPSEWEVRALQIEAALLQEPLRTRWAERALKHAELCTKGRVGHISIFFTLDGLWSNGAVLYIICKR